MKKNRIIIALAVITVTLALFIFNWSRGRTGKTISEITGVNFNKIAYVKAGEPLKQDEDINIKEFIKLFKRHKFYNPKTTDIGSTAHYYYVAYDKDNNILFTVVMVGNQGLVFIKKGSFDINKDRNDNLYQLRSEDYNELYD